MTSRSVFTGSLAASFSPNVFHPVRCVGAGDCCWSGVREKHCWLAGGWRLLLEWCERKTLLAGAGAEQQNRVFVARENLIFLL